MVRPGGRRHRPPRRHRPARHFPGRSYGAYRTILSQLFEYHRATSNRADNPVEGTLRKPHVVQRARLTGDEYDAVREKAPPWLRNAMDLSLRSLQSRAEIAAMRFDHELEAGRLFVDRAKVEHHEAGHICIEIGPMLREVIAGCRDDLASPFMVHRRPGKRRRAYQERKEHWTQVTPDMITRAFRNAREAAEIRLDLPPERRPTFHEIRSLGGDLLRAEGWSEEAIQALYGHTSAKTTRKYLDRRGREVRYVVAKAG
jgi:integrase